MKIASWNVNGLSRCRRTGFLKFMADVQPDIMCCQEIKGKCTLNIPNYIAFWNPAKRANYSGTLTLTKHPPLSHKIGLGIEKFDIEGRIITLEYSNYYVVNLYAPNLNPHSLPERYDFRREWDNAVNEYILKLQSQKNVIMCGDFNATRSYIDIYPENTKNSPEQPIFQSEERAGLENYLNIGLADVFRTFYPHKEGAYTWWNPRKKSRLENKGSRLDYFLVSGELLNYVQSIKHHTTTLGSDHCPISLRIKTITYRAEYSEDDYTVQWKTIDWSKMESELFRQQNKLAYAAYMREWNHVTEIQREITKSYAARVLAVRAVANANSAAGVDGIRLKTDAQKMKLAISLTSRGYQPLPARYEIVHQHNKQIILHIPAARDKAMLMLYSYALDPIAESTADKKSFYSRKGRSAHDAFAYLMRDLSNTTNPPQWIVRVDVKEFFSTIIHKWLIDNIPMDKQVLKKFLKSGVIKNGEFFTPTQGISFASSLSPILGNMMLDGLQTHIYDTLYSDTVDYIDGSMIRYADDIIVTARTRKSAEKILQAIVHFLSQRGLRCNESKTYIAHIQDGFDFLSWHFQKINGVINVQPTDTAIKRIEHELESLILTHKGTQRALIEKINDKLGGWAEYHRSTDTYMVFRHIDAITEGLLIHRMCQKHPRWHKETILRKFWVKDGDHYVFILPTDPTCRVMRLAPLSIVRHKPCKVSFNPYLDRNYFSLLQHRRNEQKANGKYKIIWRRQAGKCAFCGEPMLADQEIRLIEKHIGKGYKIPNLIYIHRQCAYDTFTNENMEYDEHIDLFELLEDYTQDAPIAQSPYLELHEFFRLTDKTPLSLTFQQIETILGDKLPAEAYLYDAFWLENMPGMLSPLWHEEKYPFHAIIPDEINYYISESWNSQGYAIKALHRDQERIVFRRVTTGLSGLKIPKALTNQKLPSHLVYKLEKILKQFVVDHGL